MRTDYKIGIAVVLLLGAVIIVYNVFTPEGLGPATPSESSAPTEENNPRATNELSPVSFYNPAANNDDNVIASLGETYTGRQPTRPDTPIDSAGTPRGADSTATEQREPSGESTSGRDESTSPGEPANISTRVRTGPLARRPAIAPRQRTYVVQAGDLGFWTVAKKVYGHGKYWHLIAKANPSADSNTLRAGQRLKVPALEAPTASGLVTAVAGQVVRGSGGQRFYYVKKGDAGFWKISEKVYGNGKYWALIEKANPGVDSSALRQGQKLLIPTRSDTGDRGTTVASPAGRPRTLQLGQKWYIVQAGDAGFWDVAEKSYGPGGGKYWGRIQRANPGVSSGRLRAGQKLIVPPLPTGTTVARTPDTHRQPSDDVPRFR